MNKLLEIYHEAKSIIESNLSWEAKYDMIFSEDISQRLFKLASSFTYYDPDTSYEEDVMAFYNAFTDYITEGA